MIQGNEPMNDRYKNIYIGTWIQYKSNANCSFEKI